MITLTEVEKEIIKAIRIEAEIPLASNVGYYNLIKFVRKLFKEYRDEMKYTNATIVGLIKGSK